MDILLTSGMDLKTEPTLAEEFDRLLNAVNSLELAALKQGNGFSAPVEAAPIDTVADLTFAPNPELTAKLKTELRTAGDLPLVINDQVAGYINAYANSPCVPRPHGPLARARRQVQGHDPARCSPRKACRRT